VCGTCTDVAAAHIHGYCIGQMVSGASTVAVRLAEQQVSHSDANQDALQPDSRVGGTVQVPMLADTDAV
jgi:hypothetical protein